MVSEPLGHPRIPAGQPLDIKVLVAYQPQPLTLWPLAWILTGWLEAWRLSWQPLLESDEWFLATDSSVLTACGSCAPSENVHWILPCPGSEPWKVLLGAAKFTPQRGLCLLLEFPPLPIFVRLWGVGDPNSVMLCLDEIPGLGALGEALSQPTVCGSLPCFGYEWLQPNLTLRCSERARRQKGCSLSGSTGGSVWDPWFTHSSLSFCEPVFRQAGPSQYPCGRNMVWGRRAAALSFLTWTLPGLSGSLKRNLRNCTKTFNY